MKFISLFAGIGGLDLGLERAGMECVAQVENDPWCSLILEKHWPDVPRWGDITTLDPKELPDADLICGGFPCQDISVLGKRAGLEGEHSGLWQEFYRTLHVLRPHHVLVENVASVLVRGMGDILGDLAWLGYDTTWGCIPAAAVGAPHLRARVFILADSNSKRNGIQTNGLRPGWPRPVNSDWWTSEPDVGRVAHGIPSRVDRLRGLGNAVVPQVAEYVGRLILTVEP